MGRRWCHEERDRRGVVVISTGVRVSALGITSRSNSWRGGCGPNGPPRSGRPSAHPDTFPTLEMCPYPLPNILFTTPFVHGLPVRDGRPSAFKASQTC